MLDNNIVAATIRFPLGSRGISRRFRYSMRVLTASVWRAEPKGVVLMCVVGGLLMPANLVAVARRACRVGWEAGLGPVTAAGPESRRPNNFRRGVRW